MRFTRKGHCQAFRRDGAPCTSETGLGIVVTYTDGDAHVERRWFCAAHCYIIGRQWQGRLRQPLESPDFQHCFAWHDGYGPQEVTT